MLGDGRVGDLGVVAFVPGDRQRVERGLGVPPGVGDDRDGGVPTFMTFFTPGILATLASSKLTTLAPNTGASLMAALSMPGSFTSIA